MFPQGCGRLGTRAAGWVLSLGTAVSGVPLLVLAGRSAQSPKAWCPGSVADIRGQKYDFCADQRDCCQ